MSGQFIYLSAEEAKKKKSILNFFLFSLYLFVGPSVGFRVGPSVGWGVGLFVGGMDGDGLGL